MVVLEIAAKIRESAPLQMRSAMNSTARWMSAVAFALCPSGAGAQSPDALALFGLRDFDLEIEELDDDAAKCGITTEAIEMTLRSVFDGSKIHVTANAVHSDTYVYLVVTMLESCASVTELSVETGVTIKGNRRDTVATVWKQGVVRSGGNAVQDTLGDVKGLAEWLVMDWNSVNDTI
jgi:hypothetical protein